MMLGGVLKGKICQLLIYTNSTPPNDRSRMYNNYAYHYTVIFIKITHFYPIYRCFLTHFDIYY